MNTWTASRPRFAGLFLPLVSLACMLAPVGAATSGGISAARRPGSPTRPASAPASTGYEVWLEAHLVGGPPARVHCDGRGWIECRGVDRGVEWALSREARDDLAREATRYVTAPAPFIKSRRQPLGGLSVSVRVRAAGVVRVTWLHDSRPTEPLLDLLGTVRRAGAASGAPAAAKLAVLDEALKLCGFPPEVFGDAELDDLRREERWPWVVVPNGEPEDLVDVAAALAPPRWPPRDVAVALSQLNAIPLSQLGRRMWDHVRRHPEYEPGRQLVIVHASILGGCTDGLEAYGRLAEAIPELHRWGPDVRYLMAEILSARALAEALRLSGLRQLDAANAAGAWAWLLQNLHRLAFDPEARRYELEPAVRGQ